MEDQLLCPAAITVAFIAYSRFKSVHTPPCAPSAATPFEASLALSVNTELRDALQRAAVAAARAAVERGPVHGGDLGPWLAVDHHPLASKKGFVDHEWAAAHASEEQYWAQQNQPPPKGESTVWNIVRGVIGLMTGSGGDDFTDVSGPVRRGGGRKGRDPMGFGHIPSAPPLSAGGMQGDDFEGVEDVRSIKAVLDSEPPQWMPDSASSGCMQCGSNFRPMTRSRHHCRFCGGIFCWSCTRQRCLLPAHFRQSDPQRVCDACNERLEPVQRLLAGRVSNAAQVALHDVTDPGSSLRAWLNNPLATSLQEDIFKATSTLRSFEQIGRLKPEKGIPDWVLSGAKGLAIITVFKIGIGLTYKIGTGLVIARKDDGSWSAPSAIGLAGLGYGPQLGGELTDFVIVLRTSEAVKAFTGRVHLSVGAGLSVAAGPIGRSAQADVRAGLSGTAACLSYSCSKGMFVGLSIEGSVVATRSEANGKFYGDRTIRARDLLLGEAASPRAAAPLYAALEDLFAKVDPMDCLPGDIYDSEDE